MITDRKVWLRTRKATDGKATYQLEWHGPDGKVKTKSLGKATRSEANRQLRKMTTEFGKGETPAATIPVHRLGEFAAMYLARRAQPDGNASRFHKAHKRLKPSTIREHDMTLRYLIEHFGANHKLADITPLGIDGWLAALEAGKLQNARVKWQRSRRLGAQTLRKQTRNCKAIFSWCFTFGFVAVNPAAGFLGQPMPTVPKPPVPIETFERLMNSDDSSDGLQVLFALCRLAGLRRGEAVALPWHGTATDRDGIEQTVGIDWTLDPPRIGVISDKTSMFRQVPVGNRLRAILELHRDTHGTDGTVAGLSPHNLTRLGQRAARAAGLKPWKKFYHSMRAACENDWKIDGHAEATYSAWLGHSADVSRKHYTNPLDSEFAKVT